MMQQDTAHPITREQVFFVRSIVVAMPGYVPSDGVAPLVPENQIVVNPVDDAPGRFAATMRTIINPAMDKKYPYSIDMECFGAFNTDNTLTADEALKGVTITAHNVLYGAIREAVSWLTARQPYGPLMLGLSVLQPTPANQA
jgi:preprotein translocase subunit SecB